MISNLRRFALISSIALFGVVGCKKPSSKDVGSNETFPNRAGAAGDATSTVKIGVIGKGGGNRLVIDLEKSVEYASPNLWTCYQLPADNFQFGKAVCTGDTSKNVELTALNIDFVCEVNKDFGIVRAREPLDLNSCPSYEIHAMVFKPTLDIKIME